MDRALTLSQIHISSEISKTIQRLTSLENDVDLYVKEVEKYHATSDNQNLKFVQHISQYKVR
jgi:hypothetical protein